MKNKKSLTEMIDEVGFDFSWSNQKVWNLVLPVEEINIEELIWHFDYPFWDKHGTDAYNLTPNEYMKNSQNEPLHLRKVQMAELSYPLDIMWWKERWVLLDGLHRLVKAYQSGMKKVKVRKIPIEKINEIKKNK